MQAGTGAVERIGFRAEADFKLAIEEAARADRRSLTSFIQKAVEDELVRRGFWPRKRENDEPDDAARA